MKISAPGRVCLFGEHSDWAGGYRRINADISKGYAIITGTNQGVHIDVKAHPTKFVFKTSLGDKGHAHSCEIPMERAALLEAAESGGFFSYAAGVAYQVMTNYRVRGLEIDNYLTDLPVKKGLSSSAAVCVAVARAFNRIYDLKLTIRGEMELAYLGEITTPSRCGRLDQGCAYGNRPIMMTFDGDMIDVAELSVPNDMYFVIIDLHASKDTREILSSLNHCYPFAENDMHSGVQEYLGPINARLVNEAVKAIKVGDAKRLGELMTEAQAEFDSHLQPACPSELTAPVLHKALSHDAIQPYIYGGKGVGSQGDGTAQVIAKDAESQQKVIEIMERDLGMSCLSLVLKSARRVRKAVIPAAGFDTSLFPATKAVKKELFPVIDSQGRAKPVILAIVEEALSAGIEEVGIVVQSQDRELFEEVFCTPPPIENFNTLSRENQEYCKYLTDIGNRITFLSQDVQEGLGHAVYCARDWVGEEPFLLLLGNHLYASKTDVSCARQILDVYESTGQNVVGVKETLGEKVRQFGCVTGIWKQQDSLLDVTEFYEKPELAYALKHLHMNGMPDDSFLTVFGQYVLSPQVFSYIEEHIHLNIRERGQFQLTSCLDRLRQEEGCVAVRVEGKRFDIGSPNAYLNALADFSTTAGV
jgi:UTP-glucose-1-phosphate uridylyltransferase/mevalonate kinase